MHTKNELNLRYIWDYGQRHSICVTGITGKKDKLCQDDKLFKEIIAEIFQNFASMIKLQIEKLNKP